MLMRVTKAEMLTKDIRLIRLEHTGAQPLPQPEVGSHIELTMQIKGEYACRQYSLVSPLNQVTYYEIAVKRNEEGRGGSRFLHDTLTIGDKLEVSQPISAFRLASEGKHHILIAGGIGITPMLSMTSALDKAEASYELHYSSKTANDMAFRRYLMSENKTNVFLYSTSGNKRNRIDIENLFAAQKSLSETHIYVCGPSRLIESVRIAANRHGIPRSHIHFESFGPHWDLSDGVVKLALTESEIELEVKPGTTLLDAMEAAGVWIPSDCKRGECGACITNYSAGYLIHRDHCLTSEQRKHSFCPCVSWASSDGTLSIQV